MIRAAVAEDPCALMLRRSALHPLETLRDTGESKITTMRGFPPQMMFEAPFADNKELADNLRTAHVICD
jgi:hypothetical protein